MNKKIKKTKKQEKIAGEITKDMSFSEVMMKHPEAAEVLAAEGMHCFGCAMASFETIEQGCLAHGLNPNKIVEKMNKKIRSKK